MKLQCQIDVINRQHRELNIRSNGKYIKSTLALGKEPNKEKDYFIIHFSNANKSGTKYRVNKENVKQMFVKFIKEGKSTIRFNDPPHDLCIKSEIIELKCFMKLLKSCLEGEAKALQIAPLTSLSYTAKDNAPTKLVIHNRSEYLNKGLPRTTKSLYMTGLRMCNFRRDILLLKRLTVLDLSNNEMEKIHPEFGKLSCLKELYLGNNKLNFKEDADWKWLTELQISKSLKLLDLSGNKLRYLTNSIWKLERLVTMKLDKNQLQKLPVSLGRMYNLRYLTISQNNLEVLPGSLMHCQLQYIDVSGNKFKRMAPQIKYPNKDSRYWDSYVGNLVSLAAKVIIRNNIHYAPDIIPLTLVQLLDDANICLCGAPTVSETSRLIKQYQIRDFFKEVVLDHTTDQMVSFECFFCCDECFNPT